MKKNIIVLIITTCIISFAAAQNPVPNPSFENWTSGEPDLWTTNSPALITQVSPGHTGLYAVRVNINQQSGHLYIYPRIPTSQTYTTFSFYYKSHTNGSDVLLAFLNMYDVAGNVVIGVAQGSVQSSVNNFTQMIVPISYFSTNVGSFNISFEVFSNTTPDPNNYFIVDDISLSGPTGLNENSDNMQAILLNPNPAASEITVSYAQLTKGKTEILITDATGREVINKNPFNDYPGTYSYSVNVSGLKDGIYFCRLNNDKGSVTKRFQVIH